MSLKIKKVKVMNLIELTKQAIENYIKEGKIIESPADFSFPR